MNNEIDFVITWVDGFDPEWQKLKASYIEDERRSSIKFGEERFRDWGILRYWFRAVEKYASWVRKIHFITCGQVPSWLDLDCKKLNFVKHEDFMPEKWLPTFNSRAIELNMFRIKDLSEQFVYFNDDMFLNAPVSPEDFFVNNLPCECTALNIAPVKMNRFGIGNVIFNDIHVINQNFNFMRQFKSHWPKWINLRCGIKNLMKTFLLLPFRCYTGFYESHSVISFLKSSFIEVWEKEAEQLELTSSHRFRDRSDVNPWLVKYWQIAEGKFYQRSPNFSASYYKKTKSPHCITLAFDDIKLHRHKVICINDGENLNHADFEELSRKFQQVYNEVLPEKSEFEI